MATKKRKRKKSKLSKMGKMLNIHMKLRAAKVKGNTKLVNKLENDLWKLST